MLNVTIPGLAASYFASNAGNTVRERASA